MLVKVVAVQARMGQPLSLEEKIYIFKQRPDFVCLPEYYLLDDSIDDYHRAALRFQEFVRYYARLSDELSTCLIGGTVVEAEQHGLYNTCYVFNRGQALGRYRKRFPVPGEREKGISPGKENLVLDIEGARLAVMICGDVFYPEVFSELAGAEVDLIFVPTTSLFRPDDSISRKRHRDAKYFATGSRICGAYVVKVCGVGAIFGKPLQGRSLISAPWGVVTRTDFSGESQARILSAVLDVCELREFRSKFRSGVGRDVAAGEVRAPENHP
jgi:predicted amidohydrolase